MPSPGRSWPKRYTLISLCVCATFICYIDRVNISVAIIPMAEDLGWGRQTQGLVLSSFFVGYLLTQIAGGYLADRFGGKLVLGGGVLLWSAFTIVTPPAALIGIPLLIAARVGMGMGEAVTFPAVYNLVSKWIPLQERARAIALNNSGIPLGTVFALIVTPLIVQHLGWPSAFYLFGGAGVLWWLVWRATVTARPADHPTITVEERALIAGVDAGELQEAARPPLRELLKHRAVWAIIVAHFCNNWSLYVLLSWLPTFVNQGLNVDYEAVGLFAMMPHVAAFVFLNVAGGVADRLIRNGMDVTRVRKLMQTIGFGGIAIALSVVGEVTTAWMAIAIMCAGNAVGAFVTGGFASNHMDIAPRYAGTLMGLTNTAGTIPGIIGVYVSGLILEATNSWAYVFQVAAGITVFGLIFYLLFASGKRIFD